MCEAGGRGLEGGVRLLEAIDGILAGCAVGTVHCLRQRVQPGGESRQAIPGSSTRRCRAILRGINQGTREGQADFLTPCVVSGRHRHVAWPKPLAVTLPGRVQRGRQCVRSGSCWQGRTGHQVVWAHMEPGVGQHMGRLTLHQHVVHDQRDPVRPGRCPNALDRWITRRRIDRRCGAQIPGHALGAGSQRWRVRPVFHSGAIAGASGSGAGAGSSLRKRRCTWPDASSRSISTVWAPAADRA